MTLTAEELELFDEYRPDRPNGETRHFRALSFGRVCELELGNGPSVEDVLVEMEARGRGGYSRGDV